MIGFDIGARLMPGNVTAGQHAGVDPQFAQNENLFDRVNASLNGMPAAVTGIIGNISDLMDAFGAAADSTGRMHGDGNGEAVSGEDSTFAAEPALSGKDRGMQPLFLGGDYGSAGRFGLSQYGYSVADQSVNDSAGPLVPFRNMLQNARTGRKLSVFGAAGDVVSAGAAFQPCQSYSESNAGGASNISEAAVATAMHYYLSKDQQLAVNSNDPRVDQKSPAALVFANEPVSGGYVIPHGRNDNQTREQINSSLDAIDYFTNIRNQVPDGGSDVDHSGRFESLYARLIANFGSWTRRYGKLAAMARADDRSDLVNDVMGQSDRPDGENDQALLRAWREMPLDPIGLDFKRVNNGFNSRNIAGYQSSNARDIETNRNLPIANATEAGNGFLSALGTPAISEVRKGMSSFTEMAGALGLGAILGRDKILVGETAGAADFWSVLKKAEELLPQAALPDGDDAASVTGRTRLSGSLARLLISGSEHGLIDPVSGVSQGTITPGGGRVGPSGHKNDPIYTVAISPATGTRMPTVPTPGTNTRTPPIPGQRNLP